MNRRDALLRLGASTAEAVAKTLESASDEVERGDVMLPDDLAGAFIGVSLPAIAVSVAYINGVTGGNVCGEGAKASVSKAPNSGSARVVVPRMQSRLSKTGCWIISV